MMTISSGRRHHRNQKANAARKRRAQLEKETQLHISNDYKSQKTLKRSVIKHLRAKKAKDNWICPWIKDVYWKLTLGCYPKAHLLSCPAEIRYGILRNVLSQEQLGNMTRKEVGEVIGTISASIPLLRVDMVEIGAFWKKEHNAIRAEKPLDPKPTLIARIAATQLPQMTATNQLPRKAQKVLKVRQHQRRHRDRYCWNCLKRHHSRTVKCVDLEDQELGGWGNGDKVWRMRKYVGKGQGGSVISMFGTLTKFED